MGILWGRKQRLENASPHKYLGVCPEAGPDTAWLHVNENPIHSLEPACLTRLNAQVPLFPLGLRLSSESSAERAQLHSQLLVYTMCPFEWKKRLPRWQWLWRMQSWVCWQ